MIILLKNTCLFIDREYLGLLLVVMASLYENIDDKKICKKKFLEYRLVLQQV